MSELLPDTPAVLRSVVITLTNPTPDVALKLVRRARQRFVLRIADMEWEVEGQKAYAEYGVVTNDSVHLLERAGFDVTDLPPKMRERHEKAAAACQAALTEYDQHRQWVTAMEAHVVRGIELSDDDRLAAITRHKGDGWYNVLRVDWDPLEGILERMGRLGARLSNFDLVTRPLDRESIPAPNWKHRKLNGTHDRLVRKVLAEGGMSARLHAACLKWVERADVLDKQHQEYFDWANDQVEFLSQGPDHRVEIKGFDDVDGDCLFEEEIPSEA